jgi:hypothetical protein
MDRVHRSRVRSRAAKFRTACWNGLWLIGISPVKGRFRAEISRRVPVSSLALFGAGFVAFVRQTRTAAAAATAPVHRSELPVGHPGTGTAGAGMCRVG